MLKLDIECEGKAQADACARWGTHSHGGNVAIEAANILHTKHDIQIDNLILIGTPSRDDYRLIDGAVKGEFLNIYSTDDNVQTNGGAGAMWRFLATAVPKEFRNLEFGKAGRTQPNATNIDVNKIARILTPLLPGSPNGKPVYDGIGAHSSMHNNRGVAAQIEKIMNNE